MDSGETETGALGAILGGEERLKAARDDLRQHPLAGVEHAQDHLVGRGCASSDRPFGDDRQDASVGHCVARIDRKVKQNLFQLMTVDDYDHGGIAQL